MPATLRSFKATVQPDGMVHLLQPLHLDAPADAVVTVLIPSHEPNNATIAAMQEPVETLPRFANAADLLEELREVMREIVHTTHFKKDYKRLRSSGKDASKLLALINTLQRGEALSPIHRDHALTGNWNHWRECHLGGDWLLIYRLTENEVILARTGSHSELFD